jgi:hypothetical protein
MIGWRRWIGARALAAARKAPQSLNVSSHKPRTGETFVA